MKWILFILGLAAVGGYLTLERSTAAVLQAELAQRRLDRTELDAQRQEQARLLALQPATGELEQLERATAVRAERERAIAAAEREHREPPTSLQIGEWLPQAQWQDRGRRTPEATVETLLWAAAGGDTARLQGMLQLDESGRAKLEQTYTALPATARATFAGPEQLVAAFTAKAIPPGNAQIVWQQQTGPDEAAALIWVSHPTPPLATEAPDKTATDPKAPPMLPANAKSTQALLEMRRSPEGWRVMVPSQAVERLAKELGAKAQ